MKKLTFALLILAATLTLHAQVAINTTGLAPDGSAMLDVQSDTAGILIPRMDAEQRNAIINPATGLLVFVTSDNKFYYYNGTIWVVIASDSNPVFERNGTTIRQVAHYGDDFIIGRDSLPTNGENISDNIFFFDNSLAAFRAGNLYDSKNWSPDSIGYASVAFGYNTKAKNNYSTAWGSNTTASGFLSTTWGSYTIASGNLSTASGWYSTASGICSKVWGNGSTASGYSSTAWGNGTFAKAAYETVLGQFNKSLTPFNAQYWDNRDALFVIGNGISSSARNNALTIYKNGNTIIGSDTVPANGVATTDKFLYFDKAKGSFRGGSLYSSVNWSPDSIGVASFAYGYNTKAKGHYSTAMGAYSDASGYISTALGQHTFAPSAFETSIGSYNTNYSANDTMTWNNNDRLFSIGNGASESSRNNALTIYKNGDFILSRDKIPQNGESVSDTLLFYDKSKGAFRAGILDGSKNWSPDSIGYASVAFGRNTKAKGIYSAAWGYANATGDFSTAWGFANATGFSSTAWGDSDATGDYSTAWGSANATGDYSTAWGSNTYAKSYNETALGQYNTSYTPNSTDSWNTNDRLFQIGNGTSSSARSNALTIYKNGNAIIGRDTMPANGVVTTDKFLYFDKAKGSFRGGSLYSSANWSPDSIGIGSFAYGYNTKAKGHYSTAMGAYSDASGYISTALGQQTFAPSAFETSIGSYNTSYTPNSTDNWNANDRLFQIGNGTSYSARSNALTIYKNGDFILSRDKLPENGEIVSNTLLFFDKSKAAFRAGVLDNSNNWSPDSIGYGSVAFGKNTIAKGLYSAAWGDNAYATGNYSTAWGKNSQATGDYSTVWGDASQATGDYSTAWGSFSSATGDYSTAWGQYSHATGNRSTAWGDGYATGFSSTAWGFNTYAKAAYETALGQYNNGLTPYNAITWDNRDVLFVIGNGTSSSNKHNALTLWKDGRLGLGDAYQPTYALQLPNNSDIAKGVANAVEWATYSDSRIKFNQKPLQYGLTEIMKLKPKSYIQHSSNFENEILKINNNSGKETIGLIAQEVYEVVPEASNKPEDENKELWSMDYIRLIPVLIKGMQQQQQTIEKQEHIIVNLEQRLEKLEKMMKQ